jgi:hypothetical protein
VSTLPGDWADAQGMTEHDGRPWCPPDAACAWCGIRARAVPDEPPIWWEGQWLHRRGCYQAVRLKAAGKLPADYEPIERAWAS